MESVLIILFIFGLGLMLAAPLWRPAPKPAFALAGGACAILGVAIIGLARLDPRMGQATVDANRREYIFMLACQLPVLILALVSWRRFRWTFWLGWSINLAFAIFVAVVVVWLEFFWHW